MIGLRSACPDMGRWNDMLEGRLRDPESADLGTHLESCADCQGTLERLTSGDAGWPDAAHGLEQRPRPALREAMDRLKAVGEAGMETIGLATIGDVPLPFLRPSGDPNHLGRIGAYEVLEVIGRGGMGVVLKAYDAALGRMVAIKVLAPQWATHDAARKRFEREARATAQIRHDNVVAIHAVAEIDGLPYLVMEYVPGMSLQQRLDTDKPLSLEEILRIGVQIAAGLAAAHAELLIHRDVKPANILLDTDGNVKLTDFGLARAVDDASLTQAGVIAGTPQYMAPEQARGNQLDHRADLFSLGSVLYAMCTGQPPFRASTTLAVLKRVCEDTPREIRAINPEIPDWLAAIITRLQAKNPRDRFQTADEVTRLLSQHLQHLRAPNTVRWPVAVAAPRKSRLHWWALLAAVALGLPLLACGGMAFWLFHIPHDGEFQQEEVPFEKVLADLDNGDVFARRDALQRLAKMKPNDQRAEVAKKVAALTKIDDPHIRRPAVIALGPWGTPKEIPALLKALEHSDVFTRREALKVVGRFRDKRTVGPVVRAFREPQTQADATTALRDLGPMAEKEVVALLQDKSVFLKQAAIQVLADIGTDDSVPALKGAEASGNVFLVEPARKALSAIADRGKKK